MLSSGIISLFRRFQNNVTLTLATELLSTLLSNGLISSPFQTCSFVSTGLHRSTFMINTAVACVFPVTWESVSCYVYYTTACWHVEKSTEKHQQIQKLHSPYIFVTTKHDRLFLPFYHIITFTSLHTQLLLKMKIFIERYTLIITWGSVYTLRIWCAIC